VEHIPYILVLVRRYFASVKSVFIFAELRIDHILAPEIHAIKIPVRVSERVRAEFRFVLRANADCGLSVVVAFP
jgi:hypothetical protein